MGTSHTVTKKRNAYALSNSYSARQITEGNELWERMRDGKETIQVRRKHRGTEKVMEEEKMKGNWRNMYFLCSQGGWSKIKLTTAKSKRSLYAQWQETQSKNLHVQTQDYY